MESLKQKITTSLDNNHVNPGVSTCLYRPDIDGLRAVAVVIVILFHFGVPGFAGGFVGVDIFFVISGYLITQILVLGLAGSQFSLRIFYERRVRRLVPALLTVIAAVMLWSFIFQSPFSARDTSQSVFASTVFLSNILYLIESTNYFAVESGLKPLLHTWSLSLEWQYYMVFPIFIILTWRLNKKLLLPAMVCILAISSAFAFEIDDNNQVWAYYSLHYRAWEFVAGSIAVLIKPYIDQSRISALWRDGLLILGLILICWSVSQYNNTTPFPGWHATVPVLGAFLFLSFADRKTEEAWVLTTSVFIFMGRISYSLYLWHLPVYVAFNHHLSPPLSILELGLSLVLTFTLAIITWHFIEVPARSSKRFSRVHLVVTSTFLGSAIIGLGFLGHKSHGFHEFKLANLQEGRQWIVVDHFAELSAKEELSSRLLTNSSSIAANTTLLVIGDSIGGDLVLAIKSNGGMNDAFHLERIPLHAECLKYLSQFQPHYSPKITSRHCEFYDYQEIYEQMLAADKVILAFALDTVSASHAISLAGSLSDVSDQVYLMDAPRFQHLADISYKFASSNEALGSLNNYMFNKLSDKYLASRNFIRETLAQMGPSSVTYFDRFELYCNEIKRECALYTNKGSPLIHDQHHLTTTGIHHLGNWIAPYFHINSLGSNNS